MTPDVVTASGDEGRGQLGHEARVTVDKETLTHEELKAHQGPLDLDKVEPDRAAMMFFTAAFVHTNGVFPLSFDETTREVLVATDKNWDSDDRAKPTLPDLTLVQVLATPDSLLRAIQGTFGMPTQFAKKPVVQ
jgi:hypothetical protein